MSAYPQFLSGFCPDGHGRYITDLNVRTDEEIENDCTALQWLFPTHEQSPIEPAAWKLDTEDIYTIQRNTRALWRHREAMERMMQFYADNKMWLTVGDHNHKRITRIIMNISFIWGMDDARKFWRFIFAMHSRAGCPVNETTLKFWSDAAGIYSEFKR